MTPYYLKWTKEQPCTFFMWLEKMEVPFYNTHIDYLTQEELEKYLVTVSYEDGLLYHPNGKIVNLKTPEQEYIYIIDSKKSLIFAERSETIRHSSLILGKPVIGCGSLKIDNGNLVYIDVESGHYQPASATLLNIIKILRILGSAFNSKIVKIKYYSDKGNIVHSSLFEFLVQRGFKS